MIDMICLWFKVCDRNIRTEGREGKKEGREVL